MRIGTWNLARPRPDSARAEALCAQMESCGADVWVLTETHLGVIPGIGFRLAATSAHAEVHTADELWTAIWVRNGIKFDAQIETKDAERTACVRLVTPAGLAFTVYGTVLPWLADQRRHTVTGVAAFEEALGEQLEEWQRIRGPEFSTALCVAGDFNQSLSFNGYCHGSRAGERSLQNALDEAGLTCVACGENDPVARLGNGHASIDHLCVGGIPLPTKPPILLPNRDAENSHLSDHYGVVAAFEGI